jgi:hypothetical protein
MSETQNLAELPAVARNISLPCKKCAVDRYHVVVAHLTATSAKVKCEVCGASKTFKLPKAQVRKKPPGAAKKASGKKSPATDHAAVWNDLKSQIGVDNLLPYSMKNKYTLANAINHPKFGIGFVTNATPEKIDVAFAEGGRALVHNRV